MLSKFRNFSNSKLAAVFVFIIAIPFVFMGVNSFSGGNTNNIAKINNTNITTQDFMNYLNESRISQQTIRENLEKNIIEELLSGLISTTLINLEIEDFNISITELTILKKIKENKNFQDENNVFQRTKYEKFLLSSNISAPIFELQLKNRELQKHLFDFVGAGTTSPKFLIKKNYQEANRSLEVEYFPLKNFYKQKNDFTDLEIQKLIEENKDQLEREYIDFRYVKLNPKNLTGLEEFNQDFFDKIDDIENKISQGVTFKSIIKNLQLTKIEVKEYTPSSTKEIINDRIYSERSSNTDIIENEENFILFTITDKYKRGPNLNNDDTKNEIIELVYQKSIFDFNRNIMKEIENKKFDDNKFKNMGTNNIQYTSLNSINDISKFDENSVKMLYSLPLNSFTLVNDDKSEIYLVKILDSKNNAFNETDENYLKFTNIQATNDRKNILQSYDKLLNNKYKVELNQKTIDRVKNYFK
jgi:peptidyl-prolyl cis-trans isomerase D